MASVWRRAVWATTALFVLLFTPTVFAADSANVSVKYAGGDTELETLKEGVQFFTNRTYPLQNIPRELVGLTFTRRPIGEKVSVDIDASPRATIYVLVDSDNSRPEATDLNKRLAASGWNRLADTGYIFKGAPALMAVYKQVSPTQKHFTLDDPEWAGFIVAAKNLTMTRAETVATPVVSDATHVVNQQATIKSLEIYETDTGLMLGQTSEVVLTAMRGSSPTATSVRFVTPISDQMTLSRDEALRFVRLTYPNWYVDKAEITFADKYAAHDGGSIGAAVGTMIFSVIKGFDIDPDIAITGDIIANGKIRAIGGVSAKLRAAIGSKCALVAIPTENYDQLVDAVTYDGLSTVTDIQLIGISNLNDVVATVRTDRDPKLSEAIAIFGRLQNSMKSSPDYLQRPDTAIKLAKILELAPQHLSARVLLAAAQGKQPKTLSAAASRYYTFLAARSMLAVLNSRQESNDVSKVSSGVVRSSLADLRKLRPLADPKVRPLTDAFARFIQAWNELQQGEGTSQNLETQRQALLDEMAKEDSDPQLMQKMLKEGM